MKETWSNINDECSYQVSNLGRVKAVRRYVFQVDRGKRCKRLLKERLLKPGKTRDGYMKVVLQVNRKPRTFLVHRLVAKFFVLNPNNNPCVNHKDGNKVNNMANNLEWCTYQENIDHSWKIGLINKDMFLIGEDSPRSKLKEKEVLEIRESNLPATELAKMYGVSRRNISSILSRSRWKHI